MAVLNCVDHCSRHNVICHRSSEREEPRVSDVALGPDWWQAADGKWYPAERHPDYHASKEQEAREQALARKVMYSRHSVARLVTRVLKVLSIVVLVLGILGAVVYGYELHQNTTLSGGNIVAIGVGIGIGSIIYASFVAFFAYVLDLLVQIEGNTRETGYNVRTGRVPAPMHHR